MSMIRSLRLRYFPFAGRAGAIRDALHIGRIPFRDEEVPMDQFGQRRAEGEFPFGGLPVLDFETNDGPVCAAQSNAILRFVGRLTDLYPADDPMQALKVDEAMDIAEDIACLLAPSLHEADTDRKLAMRQILAEETLPYWLGCIERLLVANGRTGFVVGTGLTVADLKLYWLLDWLTSGMLDGIPTNLLDNFENVLAWRVNVTAVRDARLAEDAAD